MDSSHTHTCTHKNRLYTQTHILCSHIESCDCPAATGCHNFRETQQQHRPSKHQLPLFSVRRHFEMCLQTNTSMIKLNTFFCLYDACGVCCRCHMMCRCGFSCMSCIVAASLGAYIEKKRGCIALHGFFYLENWDCDVWKLSGLKHLLKASWLIKQLALLLNSSWLASQHVKSFQLAGRHAFLCWR